MIRLSNWEDYLRPYLGPRALERLSGDWSLPRLRRREDGPLALPVNLFEADEEFMLVAPMPGMREEDIQIDLQRNVLTIRAQFRGELKPEETGKRYLVHGEFSRGQTATSHLLPGFTVDVTEAFTQAALPSAQARAARKAKRKRSNGKT